MFTLEILTKDLHHNTQFLQSTLDSIPDAIMKHNPAPDKWSILTILDHLRVTDQSILRLGQSEASPTERDAMININKVKKVFQNHELQLPAPNAVLPKHDDKSKEELITELKDIRKATLAQGESLGWNGVLSNFSHPITGTMTRLEWLYFCIYHTERHIYQIEGIKNKLLAKK